MTVKEVEKKNWLELVVNSDKPVVVKFGASWCNPCISLAPILEDIATVRDDINIVEVDIDKEGNGDLTASLGVRGVPTIIKFISGVEVARLVGSQTRDSINKFIDAEVKL